MKRFVRKKNRISVTLPKAPVKPKRAKTSADYGPFCGAKRAGRDKTCKNPAGFRTDHHGTGRCFKHGGNVHKVAAVHGRYSQLEYERVSEIMDRLEAIDENAMDLLPEVKLLRALLIDFINNYDKNQDALFAWLADPTNKARPRRLMDLQDAGQLVESISRVVHRLHQIQSEGAISLVTFKRVTEQMGIIVAKHVKDEKLLTRISDEWDALVLDAKAPTQSEVDDAADN